jgi:outer membrane protein OmpA-like peptidoglycan-associated protein
VGVDVAIGRRWSAFHLGFQAGYHLQTGRGSLAGVPVSDELRWGLGLGVPLDDGRWEVQVEHAGALGVEPKTALRTPAMEVVAGVLHAPDRAPLWVRFGGGPGLSNAVGTPALRVFAEVGLVMGPKEAEERKPDRDGDGMTEPQDFCPQEAEDVDNFEDQDGCPEPDNDGDGVPDALDGHRKPDGGVTLDPKWGVGDCAELPEVRNGLDDDDGCPDRNRVLLDTRRGEIVTSEKIFFAYGEATIDAASAPLLDEVAAVLRQYAELGLIEVQGHTDARGDDRSNLELSQRRAEAVREALIARGVDGARLTARGYGETAPLVPSAQSEPEHEQNRRVQFVLVSGR